MQTTAKWTAAPILGVPDVLASVEYFRSTLGFECTPEAIFGGVGGEGAVYALLQRGGAKLHLQIRRRPLNLEGRHAHECDVYLYVDDVDALYAEYRSKHVKIFRELQNEDYGVRDFTIETPDGHRLAFGTEMR